MTSQVKYYNTLLSIVAEALPQINLIEVEKMNNKPSPSKWSKKELLGHLIDSASNNYQRFIRATDQDNLIFQGYDQDAWVLKANYQNRSIDEVVNLWVLSNQHLALMIKGLSDEVMYLETSQHNFHQIGMTPVEEGTEISLSFFIWDYLFHIEYHLTQIIPGYQCLNEPFIK